MATLPTSISTAPETVIPVIAEYIAIKPGHCGGKPHIAGHRIKVQHVAVWHERMGMTPQQIVATYPSVSLPAVYAALAYYHGHRAEIDADTAADEAFVTQMKQKTAPSNSATSGRTPCQGRFASTWMRIATLAAQQDCACTAST